MLQWPHVSPRLHIEQDSLRAGPAPGRWFVTWRLHNPTEEPLQILAAWLPHGRFRGEERELTPALTLSKDESARLELPVACREPAGTVVENAFLILRVLYLAALWRVLARLRVTVDEQGAPHGVTVVVTTHPVGFSEGRQEHADGRT